jgi:hypothetical protein
MNASESRAKMPEIVYDKVKFMNKTTEQSQDLSTVASAAITINFEDLKKTNTHNAEYWSARDLQPLLGYSQWRRFEQAIERAQISCRQSGNDPGHHFAGAGKMVGLGSGSVREVSDFHLSRFACYLIAQNGDPRKPEIAQAQKYYAIQNKNIAQSRKAAKMVTKGKFLDLPLSALAA